MNYIQSQIENSFSDRFVEIPFHECDNEFMEIKIEFYFNEKFYPEIKLIEDDLTFKNIVESMCVAFEAICKQIPDNFYFIRPQFTFRPNPKISVTAKVKLRKKEKVAEEG